MITLNIGKAVCPVCDVKQSVSSVSDKLTTLGRVSHSWGGGWWGVGRHPILQFFSKTPPSKPMPPMGHTSHLKLEAPPSEKQPPPPMKSEAPFHEMIPRKSAINNNLKSS